MTTETTPQEFTTTEQRDRYIEANYPDRKMTGTPGLFNLPDGNRLSVFMNTVRVFAGGGKR